MTSDAANKSVLVVGAGPVGLTMAIELARHGVPCRLIDRAAKPLPYCRALGITPRTLEVWEDMGVAAEMIDRGLWLDRNALRDRRPAGPGHESAASRHDGLAFRATRAAAIRDGTCADAASSGTLAARSSVASNLRRLNRTPTASLSCSARADGASRGSTLQPCRRLRWSPQRRAQARRHRFRGRGLSVAVHAGRRPHRMGSCLRA